MKDIPTYLPERPVKLLDQFRFCIRAQGLAYKTEQTYTHWVKRFILFHQKKHPNELSKPHVEAFLNHLSVNQYLAPNTQKTALNALVFFYNKFLRQELGTLSFSYARKPPRIPVVFTEREALLVIGCLPHPYKLMAQVMYGSGLRISECLNLRVKDIDFDMNVIIVRSGKGSKDRSTVLPQGLKSSLQNQINYVKAIHQKDIEAGVGEVYLPFQLAKKYPNAGRSAAWQFLFPSSGTAVDPRSQIIRRHHMMDRTVQKQVKAAITKAGIEKHANCHTFRHSFATSLLKRGSDIRTIQALLGHTDVKTTEIYTHVMGRGAGAVTSPLDF